LLFIFIVGNIKKKKKKQGERDVFGSEKWSSNRPLFLEKMWKISHKHDNIYIKKIGYLINKDMKIQ
jgi:hypothetical protein